MSASFCDLKEWKTLFFDMNGAKAGEMLLTWPFTGLNELRVIDSFTATTEKQIKT